MRGVETFRVSHGPIKRLVIPQLTYLSVAGHTAEELSDTTMRLTSYYCAYYEHVSLPACKHKTIGTPPPPYKTRWKSQF